MLCSSALLRALKVYEDRSRMRALLIEAAHSERFALSELFDLRPAAASEKLPHS
jgi:hypothetical protein